MGERGVIVCHGMAACLGMGMVAVLADCSS